MKPMVLKEPAPCCGAPTLVWDKVKGYYICPCGKLEVNSYGRTRAKRNYLSLTRPRN